MLTVNKKFTIVRLLCAFAIAIALSVAVIFAVSEEPVTAIYNLFLGPLQSKRHFFEVFASSVPLIFTGLALGLVFKSGNFSMIADACLYTGAVVTAALAIKTSLPFAVHPIVIMIAAAAVGGLIGSIPALLKVYFHTNELVTSLMFNYVFFYLGIYNVTKFLADREAGTFASKKYQATASLGKLISGTNFHVGYLIAIAAVILLYILVYKTKFGYEVRISGSNPEFAKYSGIRTSRVIIMTQVIAGAVAGLGGAVEQMGMYQRFNWQDSPSYAWDGVIIAILSGNNPKMVPFAAFFLAYIRVGADLMSRRSDVQNELVSIIQAVLILFVTAERFMAGWKQREEAKKALKGEAEQMGILQEILKTLSLPEFYFAMFRSATPVLLTTLGAMISSRSGTSNIALEGTMLISAFVGVVVSAFSQSAWIGFLGAVLAGFIVSNILAYFILKLNSNAVISGIALNTFASGGTIFVLYLITGEKGASTSLSSLKLPSVTIPVVKDIPVIGTVLSGHHVLTYAALILVAVVWYMFKYTRLGMHIRAVGESPDAAESVGIPVKRIKYIALCLSGMMTGMAGAFLSMGYVGLFSSGMTAGRGYIALATQAIAAGNAVIGMLASLLFGFCQSLANYLQNSSIPLQFIQMMPYLIIIIAYTVYCAMVEHNKKKKQMKAAAGK